MSKHSSHGGAGAAGGGGLGAAGVNAPDHSSTRDAVGNRSGGESFGDGSPLNLIFGDPVAAEAHHFSLAAIPVGGGVTMSIVALIGTIVVLLVIVSMTTRMVVARCSR